MRRLIIALAAASLLSSCATLKPHYDRTGQLGFVCFPGSAIKRKVADSSAYPAWMKRERGSCIHQ